MTPLPTRAASGKPRHKQNAFAYELTALISLTKRLGTRFYLPCVLFEKDPKCTCSVDKKVPNACSMRAHEMEPKAQCNGRRLPCTGYILNARNSLLCERLQSPFTIPYSLHSEICLSSSSRVSKSISEKYNALALRRVASEYPSANSRWLCDLSLLWRALELWYVNNRLVPNRSA